MADSQAPPTPDRLGGRPWAWVPSLYFVSGAPYVLVNTVSAVLYTNLGLSNTELSWYTSWLYLPWVVKPLWSPVVDLLGTRRRWILGTQAVLALSVGLLAACLPSAAFVTPSLLAFGAMALASATHDVATDGFYMLALPQARQAAFAGIRSTAYRLAMIAGEGPLVVLAGVLTTRLASPALGWSAAMGLATAVLSALVLLHAATLPHAAADVPGRPSSALLPEAGAAFASFFRKPGIWRALPFLLMYRFAEAQLLKMMGPFLLADRAEGGLGLTTEALGFAKGTLGVACLVAGGILGGLVISRHGLKAWLWPMVLILHLPDLVFVSFAWLQPENYAIVCGGIAVEQFGYGFGFTAYMMFMIHLADGPRKTTHYAIGTAFMALGMMVPGFWAGALADHLGWRWFFVWVAASTVPSAAVVALVRVPPDFGRRTA